MNPVFSQEDGIHPETGARMVASWDDYFIAIAEVVKRRSKDPHTQIGAVIVDQDNQIVATGYNGLPRGIEDAADLYGEEKADWMVHAEANAIYAAGRRGMSLKGCKLYLSDGHFTCLDCAQAIVQVGITEVFCVEPDYSRVKYKFDKAVATYREAGVKVNTRSQAVVE